MNSRTLRNKPLVEAAVEIKWGLIDDEEGNKVDPHFKLLLSRLFDKLSGPEGKYPFHEELAAAKFPEKYAGHMVQHRFYSKEQEPPLVQVGPGVITLNETTEYRWEDFKEQILFVFDKLYEAHPKPKELRIESFALRYRNAVQFNYSTNDITKYIKEKMGINVLFPSKFFNKNNLVDLPDDLNLKVAFPCTDPNGILSFRIGAGHIVNDDDSQEKEAIIWEQWFETTHLDHIFPSNFEKWVTNVHDLVEEWFFNLIEGDLERSFNNE